MSTALATASATAADADAGAVLRYMLRPSVDECLDLWFGKSAQTDQEIRRRFSRQVTLAAQGAFDGWALDTERPRLLVALVILLDQFPRHIHRDTPRAYAGDARCRALVRPALAAGWGRRLRPIERVFLCLALTHSEQLADQQQCLQEWAHAAAALAADDPLQVFGEIFERHFHVIHRFGRFPHRNRILQRACSADEERFLAEGRFRFDLPLVRPPEGGFSFQAACGRA